MINKQENEQTNMQSHTEKELILYVAQLCNEHNLHQWEKPPQ